MAREFFHPAKKLDFCFHPQKGAAMLKDAEGKKHLVV